MLHGGAWLLADTSWGGGVKGIFQQVGEATLQAEGGGGACLAVDERGVVRRLVGRGLARTWAGGGVARLGARRLWACARGSQGSRRRSLWRETLFEAGE